MMTQVRMSREQIEAALVGLSLPKFRFFESTGSTNSDAGQWADDQAPDMALVVADEQTSGRGRMQRRWLTPRGAGLALSLVLRPDFTKDFPALILRHTALAALAVSDSLQSLGIETEIKWPNDVLIQRRKVAGILAEAHWQGDRLDAVILGIGVNITQQSAPSDEEVLFPATSVEHALGRPVDRLHLLRQILEQTLVWRARLVEPGFVEAWDERLAYKGEWVQVFGADQDQPPLEAQVLGLDPSGGLRLVNADGQVFSLQTGELHLRPLET